VDAFKTAWVPAFAGMSGRRLELTVFNLNKIASSIRWIRVERMNKIASVT
jgi:hypothetical protein